MVFVLIDLPVDSLKFVVALLEVPIEEIQFLVF